MGFDKPYQRPVHLTIITLTLTGLSLASIARWQPKYGPSLAIFRGQDFSHVHLHYDDAHRTSGALRHNSAAVKLLSSVLDRARRLHRSFYLLIACVTLRTWLHWAVARSTQCSRGGLEALLPFMTLVFEAVGPLGISPPDLQPHEFVGHHSSRLIRLSWPSRSHLVYAFLSLMWPVLVVLAMDRSEIATGTVCAAGGQWDGFVPYMQLLKCGLDAVLITHCAHLIRNAVDDEVDIFEFMGTLSLAAGGCVLLLSLPAWLEDAEFVMPLRLYGPDVRDMFLDGALLASTMVCATNLLSVLHSSAFALFISSVGFVAMQADQLGATAYLSPAHYTIAAEHMTLVMTVAAPLLYLTRHLPNVSKSFVHPSIHKWLIMAYVAVVSLSVVCWLWLSVKAGPSDLELGVAVEKLVSDAGADAGRWEAQASTSKTLAEAAAEYQRRHRVAPPPNFDKWFEFASENKSPIIDDFGQIFDDLLPFWAEEPASIRAKTTELLSREGSGMGALRIRNGTVLHSASNKPKAQAGMVDTFEAMLGPFVKWLPDMDLALNLADVSRMAVPFEEMQRIKARAHRLLASAQNSREIVGWNGSKPPAKSPWPTCDLAEQQQGSAHEQEPDSLALRPVHSQIFNDWIAPTCPSRSKARTSRWWDWALICADCTRPHSIETSSGPLVDDVSRALDPCHQPDIAYLDGFDLPSSGSTLLTHKLLPVFSQGRIGGFSDILIPSARDFADETVPDESSWGKKKNAMFWRGTGSDRSTANRRWAGLLRWRFVNEAQLQADAVTIEAPPPPPPPSSSPSSSSTHAPGINVSFTGENVVNLCDGRECEPLLWRPTALLKTQASASVPFEEHWRYRHLMDLEGPGGPGGRLLAFMRSASLPYRAVRTRSWYEERLQAWHHYVPVDVRLGKGFWAVLEFLGSNHAEERPRWGHGRHGGRRHQNQSQGQGHSQNQNQDEDAAERMARQGREWAGKALRREDMQIYMFRLLLEWGRIVDDDRERLGFSAG
ncbi:Beta-1 [Escovopsis weberi]|uniref:Beta-1 n=1 Tax=Escovopsis weberi TaxID=150374 RepID=A0A0M8MU25_ESCWE|nr:Beta-1 [Escovopsis weberi]